MFISVQDLQVQEVSFDEQIKPRILDLGSEVIQLSPVAAKGRATLIEEHEGEIRVQDIRLVGKFWTRLELKCARCLEPVTKNVGGEFDLIYRPLGSIARPSDAAISEAETEIGFYHGNGISLEDVIQEQVLLAVPIREVCQAECKGICPQCGRNLNNDPCQCSPSSPDVRWAALEEIKNKLGK